MLVFKGTKGKYIYTKEPSRGIEVFVFAICDFDAHRGPQKSLAISETRKAMPQCDLRVRWKVASDLRFRAAISEPKTPSFCGISGDLAPSTRKSLAVAIMQLWCAKCFQLCEPKCLNPSGGPPDPQSPKTPPATKKKLPKP